MDTVCTFCGCTVTFKVDSTRYTLFYWYCTRLHWGCDVVTHPTATSTASSHLKSSTKKKQQHEKPKKIRIHAQTALFRENKIHRLPPLPRGDFFLSARRTRGENGALSHTRWQVFIKTILPPQVSHRPWLPGSPSKVDSLVWPFFFFFPEDSLKTGMFLSIPVFARPSSSSISSSSGPSSHTRWRVWSIETLQIRFVCALFFFVLIWYNIKRSNSYRGIPGPLVTCYLLAFTAAALCGLG